MFSRLVIVSNDSGYIGRVRNLLEIEPYVSQVFSSCQDAKEYLRYCYTDLIMSDASMGLDVCIDLVDQANTFHGYVPAIILLDKAAELPGLPQNKSYISGYLAKDSHAAAMLVMLRQTLQVKALMLENDKAFDFAYFPQSDSTLFDQRYWSQ